MWLSLLWPCATIARSGSVDMFSARSSITSRWSASYTIAVGLGIRGKFSTHRYWVTSLKGTTAGTELRRMKETISASELGCSAGSLSRHESYKCCISTVMYAFVVSLQSRRLKGLTTDASMPVAMLALFGCHGDTHTHTRARARARAHTGGAVNT